jgi:hypothetical protein
MIFGWTGSFPLGFLFPLDLFRFVRTLFSQSFALQSDHPKIVDLRGEVNSFGFSLVASQQFLFILEGSMIEFRNLMFLMSLCR